MRGRQTGQGNWPGLRVSLLRAGSVCGIHHVSFSASTLVEFISVRRPLCLLFDLFYTKAAWFCHFSPPSSSSLCSPQCVSTLQLNAPHSVPPKREDAAFSGCTAACIGSSRAANGGWIWFIKGSSALSSVTPPWLPASVERHVCLKASSCSKTPSDVVYRSHIIYISRSCDVLETLALERGKQTEHAAVNKHFM